MTRETTRSADELVRRLRASAANLAAGIQPGNTVYPSVNWVEAMREAADTIAAQAAEIARQNCLLLIADDQAAQLLTTRAKLATAEAERDRAREALAKFTDRGTP